MCPPRLLVLSLVVKLDLRDGVWSACSEGAEATAVTAVRVGAVVHPTKGDNDTMSMSVLRI